jgi:hypothetical protein
MLPPRRCQLAVAWLVSSRLPTPALAPSRLPPLRPRPTLPQPPAWRTSPPLRTVELHVLKSERGVVQNNFVSNLGRKVVGIMLAKEKLLDAALVNAIHLACL